MDQIELCAFDGRVSITLAPSVSKWTKTRNILPESALQIAALMLRSGTLPCTSTAFGDPEVACQVVGGDRMEAWMSIQAWGYEGGPEITAYLIGDQIRNIGGHLHQIYLGIAHPDQVDESLRANAGRKNEDFLTFAVEVSAFFLHSFGTQSTDNLDAIDPLYPH